MTIRNVPSNLIDTSALEAEINNKANAVHPHQISDVHQLVDVLENKANVVHTQPISTITNLQNALDNKADASDVASTVSVLQQNIDEKASINHTHPISDIQNLQSTLNLIAPVWSETEPTNPTNNLIWYELRSDGFIKDKWLRLNNNWVSEIKSLVTATYMGESRTDQHGLNPNYNYKFLRFCNVLYPTQSLTATTYVTVNIKLQTNGGGGNSTTLVSLKYDNVAGGIGATTIQNLSHLFIPIGSSNQLIVTSARVNAGFGIQSMTTLDYQLVRK